VSKVGTVLVKAMDDQSAAAFDAFDEFDEFDWSWDDLPAALDSVIAGIAVAAGEDAISMLGPFLK
jgi:hypothetical protein